MPATVEAFHRVEVTRVRAGVRTHDRDLAATEEPLEVRLRNKPFAVIMRTPGADRELAAGFLLARACSRAPKISARSNTAPIRARNTPRTSSTPA
jgi:formate dehydrogenase assembly factor FdhD